MLTGFQNVNILSHNTRQDEHVTFYYILNTYFLQ